MSEPLLASERSRRLVAGDTVAIVAPSGPLHVDRLERGVAVLRSWGLDVRVGEHVRGAQRHLAGTDDERCRDLQSAWCDPRVAAVFTARGGSGAARIIDGLDWAAMRAAGPKILVGCSDATVLHAAVATHLGLSSLFGPMVATEIFAGEHPDEPTRDHLRRTLFEPESVRELGMGLERVVGDAAAGVTVGGTLALLVNSIGAPESRPARGGIAVLEDVSEPPYRLDSMLTQLLRTGWFDGVAGIVLATWVDCGADAEAVVTERLQVLGVPMVRGLSAGHGTPQLTVPLGLEADLDADAGTLTLRQPALR